MRKRIFARAVDAREYLDLFVVAAIASILLLRLYLHLTGYPSIGGSTYHIAHVLWGGMLMLAAFVMNFAFIGRRSKHMVALLGGVGFGIFIDEVGKFITRDNNYFFRPSIGIIYAVFVLLYVVITFITRTQRLSHQEYLLNALRYFEEAVWHDMDVHEQTAMRHMLDKANQSDPITKQLRLLLDKVHLVPFGTPSSIDRIRTKISTWYEALWQHRTSRTVVRWFFAAETIVFLLAVLLAVYANMDTVYDFFHGQPTYGHGLVIGQMISTILSAFCVIVGLRYLANSRFRAFEWLRSAILINLLLTEFFIFSRIQFGALPTFGFNLMLFMLLSVVLSYERTKEHTA